MVVTPGGSNILLNINYNRGLFFSHFLLPKLFMKCHSFSIQDDLIHTSKKWRGTKATHSTLQRTIIKSEHGHNSVKLGT